jgi:hypothetical protein
MDGSAMNTLLSAPVLLPVGGALAALFAVLVFFVLRRAPPGTVRLVWPIAAFALAMFAVIFGLERLAQNERAAERRALDQRSLALTTQVLAPGSMLGCLDSAAGEAVEGACEAAVFSDPQSVAAAVAYVSARLALLADGLDYARTADADFAERLAGLRRSIELDRFGLAAHVLSSRDGCTAERCPAFAWLRDTSALKANLRVRAYNEYVARHAAAWNNPAPPVEKQPPVASAAPQAPPSPAVAGLPGQPASPANPVPSKYDFPSAASIPPVSIMNAEPPLPAAAAAANAAAPPAEANSGVPMPPPRPPAPTQAPQALQPPAR